jgi:hypothetical protein
LGEVASLVAAAMLTLVKGGLVARAPKSAKARKPAFQGRNRPLPVTIVGDEGAPAVPESAKLSANYINGIAIGVFISGALIPSLAVLQAPASDIDPIWLAATVVCTAVSGALHLLARYMLGRTET